MSGPPALLMNYVPSFLVRLFARPYVAGDDRQDALRVAHQLNDGAQILSTLDLLAEEVRSAERVEANREAYRDLIQAVGRDPRFTSENRPTVSIKLSSFTLAPLDQGGDGSGCRAVAEELCDLARQEGVALTIDMEDRHWTDFTLDMTLDLFRQGHDVGTVLQSRLHRTDQDVERIPEGMRVRTVIGIYLEPAEAALTQKAAMKERMIQQSARLLERGAFVELATHDQVALRTFFQDVVRPGRIDGSRFEVQMLFGVPRAQVLRDIRAGAWSAPDTTPPTVRLYVPFATAWDQATAYCRRRLQANPELGIYVARNVFSTLIGRPPGLSQYLGN